MSTQPPYGGAPVGKTKTLGLDYSIAGLLAYLPICCINVITSIIWLVSEPKENKVLRFHALQSLLLCGVSVVLSVVYWILAVVLAVGSSASEAGAAAGMGILGLLMFAIGGILLILDIIGMVKAYQGQIWKIPVIGEIADKNT